MRPHGSTRPNQRPNPRGNNSPGGMPGRVLPGRPNVDPGFNRGNPGSPDMNGAQRGLGYGIGLGKGSGGRYAGPQGRGQGGGNLGMPQQQPGFDYAAFNAWQDPNISDGGASAGTLQQGWGGWGSQGSMMGTKINDYLNQFSVGGDREQQMNALGYNNGGNPYTPQVPRGTNRFYRGNAQNPDAAGYTAPGIYQHQTAGASAANIGNFGGYTGITNITGEPGSLSGSFTPFDINRRGGRTRKTRNFGEVAY